MKENVLIICRKIFKIFGYRYTCKYITFIIKISWLMAPIRKLKQISNYEEQSNGSSLLSSNNRNKKTEVVLTSIIKVLPDMFDIV